jgi:hypothetical protein
MIRMHFSADPYTRYTLCSKTNFLQIFWNNFRISSFKPRKWFKMMRKDSSLRTNLYSCRQCTRPSPSAVYLHSSFAAPSPSLYIHQWTNGVNSLYIQGNIVLWPTWITWWVAELGTDHRKMTRWIDNVGSCPNFFTDHSTTSVPAHHFLTNHSTMSVLALYFFY